MVFVWSLSMSFVLLVMKAPAGKQGIVRGWADHAHRVHFSLSYALTNLTVSSARATEASSQLSLIWLSH